MRQSKMSPRETHTHSPHLSVWPEITRMCGSLFESSKYGSTFHRHLQGGNCALVGSYPEVLRTQQMFREFL